MQNISLTGHKNEKKSLINKQLSELLHVTIKYFQKLFKYYLIFLCE